METQIYESSFFSLSSHTRDPEAVIIEYANNSIIRRAVVNKSKELIITLSDLEDMNADQLESVSKTIANLSRAVSEADEALKSYFRKLIR